MSMVSAAAMMTMTGVDFAWRVQPGCFVHVMRDKAAFEVIDSDFTDLVFLDDDIGFEPEGFITMMTHDVDVVGAICPQRWDGGEQVIGRLEHGRTHESLIECAYLGTGLLRLRRAALEHMQRAWPYIFDAPRTGHAITGEDVDFCRRYRKSGGVVWADPEVRVTHTGPKTWSNQ